MPIECQEDTIRLPDQCIEINSLVTELFKTEDDINEVCILSPKNDNVAQLNQYILETVIHGDEKKYISIDYIVTDDQEERDNFPLEFLNSLTPSGMASHILKL